MKTDTLRKKDITALKADLTSKQKELFDAKFDHRVGKEKDPSRIKKLRRDVAMILTLINEVNTMKVTSKSDKIDGTVDEKAKKSNLKKEVEKEDGKQKN